MFIPSHSVIGHCSVVETPSSYSAYSADSPTCQWGRRGLASRGAARLVPVEYAATAVAQYFDRHAARRGLVRKTYTHVDAPNLHKQRAHLWVGRLVFQHPLSSVPHPAAHAAAFSTIKRLPFKVGLPHSSASDDSWVRPGPDPGPDQLAWRAAASSSRAFCRSHRWGSAANVHAPSSSINAPTSRPPCARS